MQRSLSLCLAVHNAQSEISALITAALESAAELTPRFEVLVLDTGSTDDTVEIAYEQVQQYPQLQVVRHAWEVDRAGVIGHALTVCRGEAIAFLAAESSFDVHELRKLWHELATADIVLARPVQPQRSLRSIAHRMLQEAPPARLCDLWLMRRPAAIAQAIAAATLTDFAAQASVAGWKVRTIELATREIAAQRHKNLSGPRYLRRARSGWLHTARTRPSGH